MDIIKKILNDENVEIDSFVEVQYINKVYRAYSFFCYSDNHLYRIQFRYEYRHNSFSVSLMDFQGDKDTSLPFPLRIKVMEQINKKFDKMLTRLIGV